MDSAQPPRNSAPEAPEVTHSDKPYKCDVCHKRFKTKKYIKNHERIHTDERPYLCSICDSSFLRKCDLTRHTRGHTEERPFCCLTCASSFPTKSRLRTHSRIHTGEKPHSCQTCAARFLRKSDLNTHSKMHTGERPFVCLTCGSSFYRKSHLSQHSLIHTGEKSFKCDLCPKTFLYSSNFLQHKRNHANSQICFCPTCGARFKCENDLRYHLLAVANGASSTCKLESEGVDPGQQNSGGDGNIPDSKTKTKRSRKSGKSATLATDNNVVNQPTSPQTEDLQENRNTLGTEPTAKTRKLRPGNSTKKYLNVTVTCDSTSSDLGNTAKDTLDSGGTSNNQDDQTLATFAISMSDPVSPDAGDTTPEALKDIDLVCTTKSVPAESPQQIPPTYAEAITVVHEVRFIDSRQQDELRESKVVKLDMEETNGSVKGTDQEPDHHPGERRDSQIEDSISDETHGIDWEIFPETPKSVDDNALSPSLPSPGESMEITSPKECADTVTPDGISPRLDPEKAPNETNEHVTNELEEMDIELPEKTTVQAPQKCFEIIVCDICGYFCESHEHLAFHLNTEHQLPRVKLYLQAF